MNLSLFFNDKTVAKCSDQILITECLFSTSEGNAYYTKNSSNMTHHEINGALEEIF